MARENFDLCCFARRAYGTPYSYYDRSTVLVQYRTVAREGGRLLRYSYEQEVALPYW